jgi:hypothetical protein
MSDRKHREGSLADQLVKAKVYDEFCALMFEQHVKYGDLLEQLEKWGISSSLGALSRFWDSERSAWTITRARRMAEETVKMAPADWDEVQKRVVAERVFSLAASPNVSEKGIIKLRELEIKAQKLENDARRITILEGKMQEASAKLQELRDPAKADDAELRQRILDEVDRAMGIKH